MEKSTIDDAIRSVRENFINREGCKKSGNCMFAFETDQGEHFTLCIFDNDKRIILSRREYEELVETRRKYKGLWR